MVGWIVSALVFGSVFVNVVALFKVADLSVQNHRLWCDLEILLGSIKDLEKAMKEQRRGEKHA